MSELRIAISLAGEAGLGHASRALALGEELENRYGYEVHFYTSGEGYALLENRNMRNLHQIECLRICPDQSGGISILQTARRMIHYLWNFRHNCSLIRSELVELAPAALVVDYEPIAAYAGRSLQLPVVNLTSHNKFIYSSPVGLSLVHRLYWYTLRLFNTLFLPWHCRNIAPTFHPETFHRGRSDCLATPVFLRRDFAALSPKDDGFFMVYAKENRRDQIIELFLDHPFPVRVYGMPRNERIGNIQFCGTDSEAFAFDLSRCHAVMGGAGNQMVGEARALGKPLLLVPEGHIEQSCNAAIATELGVATCCLADDLTREFIADFFREATPAQPDMRNGVTIAAQRVHEIATGAF